MKRKLSLLLAALMAATVFAASGCATNQDADKTANNAETATETTQTQDAVTEPLFTGADVTQEGISLQSNHMNFPCFDYNDGWFYGQTRDDSGYFQLTGFSEDGSERTKLDIGTAYNVTFRDGYVYYTMKRYTTKGIYRMSADGEQMEILLDAFGEFQIVGDQLYYVDQSYQYSDEYAQSDEITLPADTCHLFRCNLDGSDPVEIIAKPTCYFYVLGNAILYQDDNDLSSLHVCSLDGSGDKKIADGYAYYPIYDGEYIYFVHTDHDEADRSQIWRVRPDGTEQTVVADRNTAGGMLLRDDSIYYINLDDNGRLYRINNDGTGDVEITQEAYIGQIQFLGDGLKYTVYSSDYSDFAGNYYCTLDGENPIELK
ncbi:MAG: DUF5050 domain-containing protein [Clostridiaceae bacterium]